MGKWTFLILAYCTCVSCFQRFPISEDDILDQYVEAEYNPHRHHHDSLALSSATDVSPSSWIPSHNHVRQRPRTTVRPSRNRTESIGVESQELATATKDSVALPQVAYVDRNTIPGESGVDYPKYSHVPLTAFYCYNQPHPGYYADPEAGCQVFHVCNVDGRQDSFLCPPGTIFNQPFFVCDWWFNVDCQQASHYYSLNRNLHKVPESKSDRTAKDQQSHEVGHGSSKNPNSRVDKYPWNHS